MEHLRRPDAGEGLGAVQHAQRQDREHGLGRVLLDSVAADLVPERRAVGGGDDPDPLGVRPPHADGYAGQVAVEQHRCRPAGQKHVPHGRFAPRPRRRVPAVGDGLGQPVALDDFAPALDDDGERSKVASDGPDTGVDPRVQVRAEGDGGAVQALSRRGRGVVPAGHELAGALHGVDQPERTGDRQVGAAPDRRGGDGKGRGVGRGCHAAIIARVRCQGQPVPSSAGVLYRPRRA